VISTQSSICAVELFGECMKVVKIVAVAIVTLSVVGGGLAVSGYGGQLFFMAFTAYNKPSGEFDPNQAVAAPDYADQNYWASLPDMKDPADLVPGGIEVLPQGENPVDTFFIHPTGFLTTASWISPMTLESGTEENTMWMMANQASAFNGCCNVYAPRFREANIFAYFGSEVERSALLGFAYQDVKRAFEYYLEFYNDGRPFILASHSQGTHHSMRLLSEVIDTSDLHERMVAAYTIGGVLLPLSPGWFDGMQHIKPCQSENDLHCVIHWDTMPEGTEPMQRPAATLCTNPLTWRVDEELASRALNEGAVLPEGTFNAAFGKVEDVPTQQTFESLDSPMPHLTSAQCRDGTLFAERQTDNGFSEVGSGMMDTYHEIDYALFYMNIHNNARLRAKTYLDLQ
jgi:hypothetical protein